MSAQEDVMMCPMCSRRSLQEEVDKPASPIRRLYLIDVTQLVENKSEVYVAPKSSLSPILVCTCGFASQNVSVFMKKKAQDNLVWRSYSMAMNMGGLGADDEARTLLAELTDKIEANLSARDNKGHLKKM
jgi:hypothetical protein